MKKISRHLFAVVLFFVLTVVFMGPAAFNPGKALYGNPGVPFTAVWWGWWYRYAHVNNFEYLHPYLQGAPFGADYTHYPIQPLRPLYDQMFLIFNEITAYNLIIFIGLFASALSMYTCVYFLTKKTAPSFIAGIIFSFSPFHLMQSTMNLWLTTTYWIPLYYLLLFLLFRQTYYLQQSRWYIPLLTAAFFTLVLFENYYYGYMTFFITMLIFMFTLLYFIFTQQTRNIRFRPMIIFCVLCFLFTLPVISSVWVNYEAANKGLIPSDDYIRSAQELNVNAAAWFNYLVPPPTHPIWGESITRLLHHLAAPRIGTGEKILFIGLIPLLLSAYSVWQLYRGKITDSTKRVTIVFFSGVILLAIILSFSFAAHLFYPMFPMFRVYSRFGIFVMVGVSILAAIGVQQLLVKKQIQRVFIMAALIMLIIFEFMNFPVYPIIKTDNIPSVYKWLGQQPGEFIVAEYPLAEWDTFLHYRYLFNQRYHQKLLFNGIRPGTTGYNKFQQAKILDKDSIEILKEIGIKYIIIHKNYFPADANGLNIHLSLAVDELKLTKTFDEEEVYEIKIEKDNGL